MDVMGKGSQIRILFWNSIRARVLGIPFRTNRPPARPYRPALVGQVRSGAHVELVS